MKKIMFVTSAAILAVLFSAFTTTKITETLAYKIPNGSGGFNWYSVDATRCPSGPVEDCTFNTPNHGVQKLYEYEGGPALTRQ